MSETTANNKSAENIPWVSFCMTTYKRPEFLRKQLQTLAQQTFTDFQVIISDNDPEGSGEVVVREFNDPRVLYFRNEENLGMVKSFNRSLSRARSEFVVMITDDDPVYPDMLMELKNLSIEYPGFGMYYGGCDILCMNPLVAKASRLKVGTNSCLADLPIGEIRTYTSAEFPAAFFSNQIGAHLLWSTGIVKREIALAIDGMPDYGSPFNTDFGYVVLAGAHSGAVLVNKSLGCQVVHGTNYGYKESDFEKFLITPNAFYNWILERLDSSIKNQELLNSLQNYIARWTVEYAVAVKKLIDSDHLSGKKFNFYINEIFRIHYLKKWKWKYYIATTFPKTFELLIYIKSKLN